MKKALVLFLTLAVSFAAAAQDTMMKTDKPAGDGSMMKTEGSMMKADASAYDLTGLGKQVAAFTSEKDAWTLAKKQTVVYFFAATWCPDCQATYRDLQAHNAQLPANLTVLFVNYDKSADLKKKYGVTMQHTFVVVGPAGEKKKVWNGATTAADLVKTALGAM